ncbi:MAG TPA: hypothetical protein VJ843_02685 [Candidatus Saccharimonadales bacterium]|nr:hypothetical protein [Candidatus Saccharimonadales bacterium]
MRRLCQKGGTLLLVLVIVGVIGLMGVMGILLWQKQKADNKTASDDTTSSSKDSSASDTPSPLLYAKYTSTDGKFSFYYPKGWLVTGYKNGQQVPTLDGSEDRLHMQVADSSNTVDNFGGDLYIANTAPGDAAWPLYPNGTVLKTYSNGIGIWEDNQTQTLQTGQTANMCPSIRIASDDAFGFKLTSGKYISFIGSFCWAPGFKTSYSYGQQTSSDEFGDVMVMFASLKQN